MIFKRIAPAFAVAIALAFLSGCASRARKADPNGTPFAAVPQGNANASSNEAYGPGGPVVPLAPVYGPEPSLVHPIVLVLGPGQARGFANAGALRALSENKIPIAAIYGVEIGGLMGALYAHDANINHFEWALQGFGQDTLSPHASLMDRILKKGENGRLLNQKLQQEFGNFDISATKIPLRIALFPADDPTHPVIVGQGPATQIVRDSLRSLSTKPLDLANVAAAEQLMCDEARAHFGSPVILIETFGSDANPTLPDPSSADLVIRPELGDVSPLDYSKDIDAAFRGKTAVNQKMAEISHAVNIPNPQAKTP